MKALQASLFHLTGSEDVTQNSVPAEASACLVRQVEWYYLYSDVKLYDTRAVPKNNNMYKHIYIAPMHTCSSTFRPGRQKEEDFTRSSLWYTTDACP